MSKPVKFLVLCTVEYGLDALKYVMSQSLKPEAIIGIDPGQYDPEKVSGLIDVKAFGKANDIQAEYVTDYALKSDESKQYFEELEYDLIWVVGWQRLVPKWLIDSAKYGVLGGHGSPDGITEGRGRSPQNWALILGLKQFHIALFQIQPGIDDGPVLLERTYQYNSSDDIATSYKKASLCLGEMVVDVLKNPIKLEHGQKQTGTPYYYPQRKPEDGYADWQASTEWTLDHVRALTRPYPGLRTKHPEGEVVIWKMRQFDNQSATVGEVQFVFEDGSLLVATGDGRVLIDEYACLGSDFTIQKGDQFESVPKQAVLENIVNRHQEKYPNLPLTHRLLVKLKK